MQLNNSMSQISRYEELKEQLQNEKWQLEFEVIEQQNRSFNQGAKLKKYEKRICKLKSQLGIYEGLTEIDQERYIDGFDSFKKSDCDFFGSAQKLMSFRKKTIIKNSSL